mgnify:CR=1 FL=1
MEDHAYRFLRECIWKFGSKMWHFLQRIFHLHFPQKSAGCTSYHIPSHIKKGLPASSGNPFSFRYMLRHARLIHTFHRSSALFYGNNLCQISWLIYIEPLIGGHIVSEKLQCHRCRQHHELILLSGSVKISYSFAKSPAMLSLIKTTTSAPLDFTSLMLESSLDISFSCVTVATTAYPA